MKSSSGLRAARSMSDLDDRKAFDIKVGYIKKKIPPISTKPPQKALVVTMYRNGDNYFPGTKVSLRPGKDFMSLSGFCEYLSQRMQIPQGVRYIFDLNGRLINSLEKLEDGGSYVAAGTKTFRDIAYGKLARLKTGHIIPNAAPLRPDDMHLYKPAEHVKLKQLSPRPPKNNTPDGGVSLPGSRESCVVTVVNKKEPSKRSRVLLNLKTKQSWEAVVRDMGQAIGMKNRASKMLTPWGDVVKSFSQLRNDFSDVETFYLDFDEGHSGIPRRSKSEAEIKEHTDSDSLRIKIPEDTRRRWPPG